MLTSFKSAPIVSPARRHASPSIRTTISLRPDVIQLLFGVLLALGVGMRLFHFFNNRSFFIDELYLHVNTIRMGFWALATEPFAYEQKAPIGYLWVTRLFILLFGKQEMALRLFPLLCGIGTLLLFTKVARHFLKTWGALATVGILAFSAPCVYHSVEAKQYSTELFVAVLALWLYIRHRKNTSIPALVMWGVLGAIALWFSFSAIFVFASIAIVMSSRWLFTKNWRKLFLYLIPFSLWLVSFGLQYYFIIGKYPQSGWLIDFFDKMYDGFMPIPPKSTADFVWYFQKPYYLLFHPLGLLLNLDGEWSDLRESSWRYLFKLGWLSAGIMLGGMGILFMRSRTLFFCLLLPLLLVLLGSALRVYPFYGRFVLFLAPSLLLFIGFGVDRMSHLLKQNRALFFVAISLLLLPGFINSSRQVINPDLIMSRELNREPLLYINEHFQPGDAVYVFWNMSHAYEYYKQAYPLKYTAVQGGYVKHQSHSPADYLRNLQPDFEQLKGKKRIWFVFDYINRNAIGDYVGQPLWFHDSSFDPTTEVQRIFMRTGRKVLEYPGKPYLKDPHKVALFEMNQ